MSTFKLEIIVCTCCYRPLDLCKVAQYWIRRGVPEEWITEERLYPEDVNAIDTRLYTGRTQGTG